MLSDQEISIIALLRGLDFASTVFKIDRVSLLKKIAKANLTPFFYNIRREILTSVGCKGMDYVVNTFNLTKEKIISLKPDPSSDFEQRYEVGGRKRHRKGYKLDNFKAEQEIVTSTEFFKTLGNSKNNRGFIFEKTSALSKEFLVQEAEKLSSRVEICEKFDIDRGCLKDWVRSYHKVGVLTDSTRKFNAASEVLKKAYAELCNEIDLTLD